METVTFYSYKGGVGRTLALKNYAVFLANYGYNVCVLDFDLEAPGLHYKFANYQCADSVINKKGIVDLIFDYQEHQTIPDNFQEYCIEPVINIKKSIGKITLIPAGNSMSVEYWNKLSSIQWGTLFHKPKSDGELFFLELKERIQESIKPDFLLIDSRTGVTEVGGLCTSLLPDKVVFLICNNDENKEGARLIYRSLRNIERPWTNPIEVVFALSRFPFYKNEEEKKIEENLLIEIARFLNDPITDANRNSLISSISILYSDRALEISESQIDYIEPFYNQLFLKIIPPKVKDKIQAELVKWAK